MARAVVPDEPAGRSRLLAQALRKGRHAKVLQQGGLLLGDLELLLLVVERPEEVPGDVRPVVARLRLQRLQLQSGRHHRLPRRAHTHDGVELCDLQEWHLAVDGEPQRLVPRAEAINVHVVEAIHSQARPTAVIVLQHDAALPVGLAGLVAELPRDSAALALAAEDHEFKGAGVQDARDVLPADRHVAVILHVVQVVQPRLDPRGPRVLLHLLPQRPGAGSQGRGHAGEAAGDRHAGGAAQIGGGVEEFSPGA
mmetsp:Transcript_66744/g.177773  ORF Transcript_66744/g.177773 Transcript_66744/m.177773 type:complete len:253 (+) Transcript_66744:791-1549(+)